MSSHIRCITFVRQDKSLKREGSNGKHESGVKIIQRKIVNPTLKTAGEPLWSF